MNVTPHVAAKAKGSAIDRRTTRHAGYAISQRIRKRIEETFGWSKTVVPVAKTMLRGLDRVGGQFTLNACRVQSCSPAKAARRIKGNQMAACGYKQNCHRDGSGKNKVLHSPLFQQPASACF